jgi:hypothetical protein
MLHSTFVLHAEIWEIFPLISTGLGCTFHPSRGWTGVLYVQCLPQVAEMPKAAVLERTE